MSSLRRDAGRLLSVELRCERRLRCVFLCVSSGIKHEWQVNGLDDIQDRSTLAEKLGGNVVVSLEGKPM